MQYAGVNGCPHVSPVTCAGAVAMTIARTEKQYQLMTISGSTLKEVALRPDLPLQNITVGVLGASEKVKKFNVCFCRLTVLLKMRIFSIY